MHAKKSGETGGYWAVKAKKKGGSQPISRVLSRTIISLRYASPRTSSNLPENSADHTHVLLFGLAPNGVYPATAVASSAVRSYRTISPLPAPNRRWRYIFCGTFRRLTPPRRYLAFCPVEPGLSSIPQSDTAIAWLTSLDSLGLKAGVGKTLYS